MHQPAHISHTAPIMTFLLGELHGYITTVYNAVHSTPCRQFQLFLFHPRCARDAHTKVELNGASQVAHFSFEAFRFTEHRNQTVSTFYLHCITRLCEVSSCSRLLPVSHTSHFFFFFFFFFFLFF